MRSYCSMSEGARFLSWRPGSGRRCQPAPRAQAGSHRSRVFRWHAAALVAGGELEASTRFQVGLAACSASADMAGLRWQRNRAVLTDRTKCLRAAPAFDCPPRPGVAFKRLPRGPLSFGFPERLAGFAQSGFAFAPAAELRLKSSLIDKVLSRAR